MGKKNKDIMENTEQEENSNEQNEQAKRKKYNIKKILFIALGITLVLCLGIFISFNIYTTEIHVYEEVENLGEREGVCFDNLLLSSCITLLNSSGEEEYRHLCIFNTGDIYCFEWLELYPWNWYYEEMENNHNQGYDDKIWSETENVVYLGRLSNRDIIRLNRYVQDFDIDGKYYNIWDTYSLEEPDGSIENQKSQDLLEDAYLWKYYNIRIFWHKQPERFYRKDMIIENYEMNYLGNNRYEKGEVWQQSYEENALAALELFESSEFYDRWVDMCLNNR